MFFQYVAVRYKMLQKFCAKDAKVTVYFIDTFFCPAAGQPVIRELLDRGKSFCQAAQMNLSCKKLVAVILALWLPLFGGSALAAMSLHGSCKMDNMHFAGKHASQNQPADQDQQDSSCEACGICHMAYLAVPDFNPPGTQPSGVAATPYLFSFHSITSVPLIPPPLART